jgi:hypothetical protein
MIETVRSYLLALLSPSWWSIIGLAASLIGVLLLFRYGMPYRTRTGGETYYVASGPPNKKEQRAETIYTILGWLGLVIVILGTLCQMIGAWLSN